MRGDDSHEADFARDVVSALLNDSRELRTVVGVLQPSDIASECERTVFEAIVAIDRRGDSPDLERVRADLAASGALERIGGDPALGELLDWSASAVGVVQQARELKDLVLRGKLKRALAERVEDPSASAPKEREREIEEQLAQLREGAPLVDPKARRPVLTLLADVTPEPLRWLWPGRIPLGAVSIIDGDPGLGKSLLTLDLAARITTGRAMPDESAGVHGAVILVSYEDDLAAAIRPRLDAAGADSSRVHALGIHGADGEDLLSLPTDLEALEDAIRRTHAVLVIVDPLMAALSGQIDAHRDQDVRRVLTALKGIAQRTGAAIVLVRHLRKTGGANAIYAGGGSIGIVAAARAAHLVTRHPHDRSLRVFALSKLNSGPELPALAFRIVAADESGAIEWLGMVDLTADDLLTAAIGGSERPGRLDEAKDWLASELEAGPKRGADLRAAAEAAGIAVRTLERAKTDLGVRSIGGGKWALPSPPPLSANFGRRGGVGGLGGNGGTAEIDRDSDLFGGHVGGSALVSANPANAANHEGLADLADSADAEAGDLPW